MHKGDVEQANQKLYFNSFFKKIVKYTCKFQRPIGLSSKPFTLLCLGTKMVLTQPVSRAKQDFVLLRSKFE